MNNFPYVGGMRKRNYWGEMLWNKKFLNFFHKTIMIFFISLKFNIWFCLLDSKLFKSKKKKNLIECMFETNVGLTFHMKSPCSLLHIIIYSILRNSRFCYFLKEFAFCVEI